MICGGSGATMKLICAVPLAPFVSVAVTVSAVAPGGNIIGSIVKAPSASRLQGHVARRSADLRSGFLPGDLHA